MTSHETPEGQARRVADSLRASGLGRAVEAAAGHDPTEDLILTVDQAAAYQAWTDATNADLGGGALERFARTGFSYRPTPTERHT